VALPVHFALVILEIGVSRTISLGWPQTSVLPTSVTQVAGSTGVSHQRLASHSFFLRIEFRLLYVIYAPVYLCSLIFLLFFYASAINVLLSSDRSTHPLLVVLFHFLTLHS
jgi:hypothetical protein